MFWYIYGDNVFSARKKLNETIDKIVDDNPQTRFVNIEKKSFDEEKINSIIKSPLLFDQTNAFLIDGYSLLAPKQKNFITDSFSKSSAQVIFWDSKDTSLANGLKKTFPQLNVFHFPKPKLTFVFLEKIFPGNQKESLSLFAKIAVDQPLELVLYFLKQHFRTLAMFTISSDLISNLPSWREAKISSQVGKFPKNRVTDLYRQIINLEYRNKSGNLPVGLEIALVNLLATV